MLTTLRSSIFCLLLAAAVGCNATGPATSGSGDDDGAASGNSGDGKTGEGHQAIDEYVQSIPDLVLPAAQGKTEVECMDANCPADAQEGDAWCIYRHYTETLHFDRFVAFQPNSATLWPGVVVKGADAQEGLLTPVGVKLAPVTFSFSLENIANSPVGHMEDPSLSSFRDERNKILAGGVTGATAASLDFNVLQVHSESQIATALGAGVNWPGGPEIAGSFNFNSSDKKTKILVNFTQAYYTVDVDAPATPKDFFDPSVTVDDLKPYADAASPPLYVQSITYGRRVIFSIESDEPAESVKAALEATYSGAVNGKGNVSAEQQKTLQASTMKAFVVGGSGGDATGAISGFEGLVEFIKKGGNYSADSPGAPIAYKLAYLDNTVTKLAFTTEYSERECTKNRADLRVELVSVKHIAGGEPFNGDLEMFGWVAIQIPTAQSPVTACGEGGTVKDIWNLDAGSYFTMPQLSTWTPTSPQYIDLNDVPVGPDAKMCLGGEMWESDVSSDDYFGYDDQLVGYVNGWDGQHTLQLRGPGNLGVDVTINVTVK